MPSIRRCLTLVTLGGAAAIHTGCEGRAPPERAVAAADAAVDPAREAALAAVWRESVRYRSAHLAYATNAPGMAQDVSKVGRMLATVEALEHTPVVADPAADAAAVEAMLRSWLAELKIRGASLEVRTRPAPAPVARRISSKIGLEYAPDQVAGTHEVTVTLPEGLVDGARLLGSRGALPRLFVVTSAAIGARGVATLRGEIAFFRDLQPVEFFREPPDPARLIADAAGAPPDRLAGPLKATAERILANYAQVEAAQGELEKAYQHEARLKIDAARFAVYSAIVDRFNGATWASLMRGEPVGAGGGHAQ